MNEAEGSFVTVAPADVSMTCSPSCSKSIGNSVTVVVTGHFKLIALGILPFLGDNDIELGASTTASITQFPSTGVTSTATPTPTPTPTAAPTPTPTPAPSGTPAPTATPTPTPTPTPATCSSAPAAAFTVSPNPAVKKTNVTFTSTTVVAPGCVLTYSWAFGDGAVASPNASYIHQYDKKGTYTAALTVTNQNGQSGSATVVVTVNN